MLQKSAKEERKKLDNLLENTWALLLLLSKVLSRIRKLTKRADLAFSQAINPGVTKEE